MSSKDKLSSRTTNLTKSQLDKLTEDPKNLVYDYTHDQVERVKSVEEVKYLIQGVRQEYLTLRANQPDLCDRACRRQLTQDSTSFADFAKTHPLMFERITNRDATEQDFQIMFAHLRLRALVESGRMSHEEATQKVNLLVLEHCKTGMTYDQWKAKQT